MEVLFNLFLRRVVTHWLVIFNSKWPSFSFSNDQDKTHQMWKRNTTSCSWKPPVCPRWPSCHINFAIRRNTCLMFIEIIWADSCSHWLRYRFRSHYESFAFVAFSILTWLGIAFYMQHSYCLPKLCDGSTLNVNTRVGTEMEYFYIFDRVLEWCKQMIVAVISGMPVLYFGKYFFW